jgi:hypothetical protein
MVVYKLRNSAKENNGTGKPGRIFTQNGIKMGKPSEIKTVLNGEERG